MNCVSQLHSFVSTFSRLQKHAYLSGGMDTVQLGHMFGFVKEAQEELYAMLQEISQIIANRSS